MMPTLTSLVENRYVVFTGWTLGVVLWETTVVGVLFAAWRLRRHSRGSDADYIAGLFALFGALAIAVLTPWILAVWPQAARTVTSVATPSRLTPSDLPASILTAIEHSSGASRTGAAQRVPFDDVAGAAALVWAVGVVLLSMRLAGGWVLAQSLARRARPLRNPQLTHIAAQAAAHAGVVGPFDLLDSPEVDAPVVLRWRSPAVLVPRTPLLRLGPDQMAALLTHEFAHIRRRDYLVNVLQSVVELLLFFSPAVLWTSRRVREAREFCCDDVAVSCGSPGTYVEALTTLARFGTMNAARAAQGISGPRLITRVRRLLKEEPMPRFRSLRVLALATALVALVLSGIQLSAASAARNPSRATATPQVPGSVPYGYATTQEGSGVTVTQLRTADDGSFESVTVQNLTTERITALRLVAAVERRTAAGMLPVRLFVSKDILVSIEPNETTNVTGGVLTASQIAEVARNMPDARLQTFFALQAVRFGNAYTWSITPNPDAHTGSEAVGTPQLVHSRALIERDATRVSTPGGLCVDDRGRLTSPGALVPILNEPGHLMRCVDARWVESAGR